MKRTLPGCLIVGLQGHWPTPFEAAWLVEHHPTGVILFSRNIKGYSQLRDLCDVLRQLVPGLEICADHEGGPVSQLALALERPPAAWGLGVLDDPSLTARVCEETGECLMASGVDRVLAPVADVLTERLNPVIGSRSFGADAAVVSRQVVAAVTGYLRSGIKVCLKHWPGHGGSLGDSHLIETDVGPGVIPVPFENGLTAGADAVMVGHLLRPSPVSGGGGLPTTLDAEFLTASRKQLEPGHVEGLLFFADDVTMGALGPAMARAGVEVPESLASGLFDPATLPRSWFEALAEAGCDRLLIRGIPSLAFPLSGEEVRIPEASTNGSGMERKVVPGSYEEARELLWRDQLGDEFADKEANLLWLDFSRGDRWEAASGQPEGTLGACKGILDEHFRSVMTDPDQGEGGQFCRRLLVSAHRPLAVSQAEMLESCPILAPEGICLVMGHPCLKSHLEGVLGPGWTVGALFDITPEDLFPQLPASGTKI